jgi:hypothetical protein
MSVSDSELFVQPPNLDITVWRYMDFAKYVSLLANKALYFTRLDLFDDPFEDTLTRHELELCKQYTKEG